jgi:hypothetical protein
MRYISTPYWRTLKKFQQVEEDGAHPNNCLVEMWDYNFHYWKTPNANRNNERMQAI